MEWDYILKDVIRWYDNTSQIYPVNLKRSFDFCSFTNRRTKIVWLKYDFRLTTACHRIILIITKTLTELVIN